MDDFALVTEGVTDHAILKQVLQGYFQDQRDPIINRDHPDPSAEERYGGWTLVIRYLRDKKYREAFQTNRFVIVQIDTDVTEDAGFDVPKQDENGPLPTLKLVENVVAKLREVIGEEDWATHGENFIFAIGVDQLECWVLPLWFNDAKAKQTANCIGRLGGCPQLRDALSRKNLPWIRPEEKNFYSYEFASREYRKKNTLLSKGPKSPSLEIFLDELGKRNITLAPVIDD